MREDWNEDSGMLTRTFTFANFKVALDFVVKVGGVAETLQHHPDIAIKNYNTVTIATTTHDKGGVVTEKDHELARAIDEIQ